MRLNLAKLICTHFCVLHCFSNIFSLCFFPFLSWWHPYPHICTCCSPCFSTFCFLVHLCGVGCLASQVFGLAPFSLLLGFAPLVGFCCCVDDIRILGVLVGFGSFSSSFLQKALGLGFNMFTMLMCFWSYGISK